MESEIVVEGLMNEFLFGSKGEMSLDCLVIQNLLQSVWISVKSTIQTERLDFCEKKTLN